MYDFKDSEEYSLMGLLLTAWWFMLIGGFRVNAFV